MCCGKCMKSCGLIFLVIGILYLLTDLAVISFFNVNWWTVLFIIIGVGGLASSNCPDCQALAKGKKKK